MLEPRSQTIIFAMCSKYALAEITIPRWQRYAQLHRYDFLRISERNKTVTGMVATPAWDRAFLALQLFRKGYQHVMHVDGDTAILAWEKPVTAYIHDPTGPFAHASSDAFLYVSQDRSQFGRYQPSRSDFEQGISLHPNGQISGPNNFGLWLIRRSLAAFVALEHLVSVSQNKRRAFQKFPAEQGVMNAWLGQNCSCRVDKDVSVNKVPGIVCPAWSRLLLLAPARPCAYAQASYGTFQRFLGRGDSPLHLQRNRSDWAGALNATLREYRRAGVFVVHTPSMSSHSEFLAMVFRSVEAIFPIPRVAGNGSGGEGAAR